MLTLEKQITDKNPINQLGQDPNLPEYKTRKGRYRILMDIIDESKEIRVYKVIHRSDAYNTKQ